MGKIFKVEYNFKITLHAMEKTRQVLSQIPLMASYFCRYYYLKFNFYDKALK